MRTVASVVVSLLLLNVGLTIFQVVSGGVRSGHTTSESTLAEADKLFQIASDFQTQTERLILQLHPVDEKENKAVKEKLRDRAFHFELYRVRYLQAKTSRQVQDLELFLWMGTVIVDVPTGILQEYKAGEFKGGKFEGGVYVDRVNYANLTNMEDQYYALATSLSRDLK
jgi:hypothetical protein